MKKTRDRRIWSEMENDYTHITKTDAMGDDVSNMDGLFSDCPGVLIGWLWDSCGIRISSLLLNFNFLFILGYGVYGIH